MSIPLFVGIYVLGVFFTLYVNLRDMVVITHPLVILRNILLWPMFLPLLLVLR